MMYQIFIPIMIVAVYFLFKIFKTPRPFLRSVKSIFFSMSALLVLNTLSSKIGIFMPLNLANILTAGIFGAPGICLMTILNVVF